MAFVLWHCVRSRRRRNQVGPNFPQYGFRSNHSKHSDASPALDDSAGGHVGVDASCYPTGQVLVVLGLCVALFSLTIVICRCCLAATGSGDSIGSDCLSCCTRLRRPRGPSDGSSRPSRWRRGQRYQLIESHSDDEEEELQPAMQRPVIRN